MAPTEEIEARKGVDQDREIVSPPAAEVQPSPEADTSPEAMSRDRLLQQVEELRTLADKHFDLYVRSEADLENAKKRFVKEKAEVIRYAAESLIKQLLPVMDNLEKAIAHARTEGASKGLVEGMELTLKGFQDVLTKAGLIEIKAVGAPFDPNYHEATFQKEDARVEPGTVLEEYQKGYLLNERLIRPSMVVVSAGTDGPPAP